MEALDDIREILKYLPHRYPFLMVDRVLTFEKNKSLTAIKNVTFNEPIFTCLLYTSPSPRDGLLSRMPSSA